MKRKSASEHEIPKTAGKSKGSRTVRAAQPAAPPVNVEPPKPKRTRAPKKTPPIVPVETPTEMLQPKSVPAPIPTQPAPADPTAAKPAAKPSALPFATLPQQSTKFLGAKPKLAGSETGAPTAPQRPLAAATAQPEDKLSARSFATLTQQSTESAAAKPSMPKQNGADEPKMEKVKVEATTEVRRTLTRKRKTEVPPILLEGDEPSGPVASGPGEKYSLGATPPAQSFSGGELPDSYGTRKLFLTARDPHWLYATWDLTPAQQKELNAASTDGHLILRIYAGKVEGHPAYEIHVHPESRHWFAHVERAGNSYAAELGYYSALGKWMRVAVSSGTLTPPDAASEEGEADFATIPFEFPFAKLMQIIEEAVRDNLPLAVAIEELRRHGHPDLPRFSSSGFSSIIPSPSGQSAQAAETAASRAVGAAAPLPGKPGALRVWTPEQEKALARIINIDQTRRIWMGSLEITELIRRRLAQEVSSPVTAYGQGAPGAVPPAAGLPGVSSPMGGQAEKGKGFWFNVNAELVIYGATEANAKVTLGGHEIKLRADGTFSFRFALPDGKYDLPAVAVSADGTDGRAAELKFSRSTEYLGEVGTTPSDPALKPPLPETL